MVGNPAKIWNYIEILEVARNVMIWNYDNLGFSLACNYIYMAIRDNNAPQARTYKPHYYNLQPNKSEFEYQHQFHNHGY